MKKKIVLAALMLATVAGFSQESRQDVSVSGTGLFVPQVNGNAIQMNSTIPLGILASYRYMVTPRSALELNYTFSQNITKYNTSFNPFIRIHTRTEEVSGAYVYNVNYRNFNPFAEIGVGALIFTPVRDFLSNRLDTKQNTNIGGLFGAGIAYELSPSFDIRAEYRGFVVKSPDFGLDVLKTNRYMVVSTPAIGVAYHF